MQVIVHDCYTLSEYNIVNQHVFQYIFYRFVEDFVHIQNPSEV